MLSKFSEIAFRAIKSQESTGNPASQLVIEKYPIDLLH
jgi:hypothetical protein